MTGSRRNSERLPVRARAGARLLLAAAIVVVGVPPPALGQTAPRQTATLVFDQQRPAQSTGVSLAIDYVNPDDPAAKPPAVQKVVMELAPGTAIDDSVPALCQATDQELVAKGPEACPAESKVGGGEIDIDTGIAGPARILRNNVTTLNNRAQLILLLESQTSPPRRLVVRAAVQGATITSEVPPTPGGPPDGFSAVKRVRLRLEPRVTGDQANLKHYVTTPTACPTRGAWSNKLTFTYRDGLSDTVVSSSPCTGGAPENMGTGKGRDSTAPRIRVRGVPRKECARRGFRVRVRIAEHGSGLRRARLWLDRKRLLVTQRSRFSRRIRVAALRGTRHRLKVVAVDKAGNRSVKSVRFRRCRR
jgi:hypothetical protein